MNRPKEPNPLVVGKDANDVMRDVARTAIVVGAIDDARIQRRNMRGDVLEREQRRRAIPRSTPRRRPRRRIQRLVAAAIDSFRAHEKSLRHSRSIDGRAVGACDLDRAILGTGIADDDLVDVVLQHSRVLGAKIFLRRARSCTGSRRRAFADVRAAAAAAAAACVRCSAEQPAEFRGAWRARGWASKELSAEKQRGPAGAGPRGNDRAVARWID